MLRSQEWEKPIRRRKCPVEAEMNLGEILPTAFSEHERSSSLDGSGKLPHDSLNSAEGLFQSLNQSAPFRIESRRML
jgi:hypothetical protein